MAALKVGMRVRVVGVEQAFYAAAAAVGHEGIIVRRSVGHIDPLYVWIVDVPTCPMNCAMSSQLIKPSEFFFRSCDLAPLTDPKADAFLESLKKLKFAPRILTEEELQNVKATA
jgi:hypothetical protein